MHRCKGIFFVIKMEKEQIVTAILLVSLLSFPFTCGQHLQSSTVKDSRISSSFVKSDFHTTEEEYSNEPTTSDSFNEIVTDSSISSSLVKSDFNTTEEENSNEPTTSRMLDSTTPFSTAPSLCACESMKLVFDEILVGTSWFVVPFNSTTSSSQCSIRNLTGLNVSLSDPFDQIEEQEKVQTCTAPITCLHAESNTFVFNSTLCCKSNLTVRQCSNYSLLITPIYSPSCPDYSFSTANTSIFTLPSSNATPKFVKVNAVGFDWVQLQWADYYCKSTLTSYLMNFEILSATHYLRESTNFTVRVPSNCTTGNQELTFFNSTTCPKLLILKPCTKYSIKIKAEFFGIHLSNTSSPQVFNTTPRDDAMAHVTNIKSGKSWISFSWQVSRRNCINTTTGLWIKLSPSQIAGSTVIERSCPAKPNVHGQFYFNTSDSCFNETLYPCSDYELQVSLDSNGTKFGKPRNISAFTTPGDDASAKIISNQYGVDWISFSWRSTVEKCQKFVIGYRLNISDVFNGTSQHRNLSITCSANQSIAAVVFNSSLPCADLNILPCSKYLITVTPEFNITGVGCITGVDCMIGNASSALEIGSKSGEWGEIEQPTVSDRSNASLTLEWRQPVCTRANLIQYNITIKPNWNSEPNYTKSNSTTIIVKPDCLTNLTSGRVSVNLNQNTCADQGYKFISCSPYVINVFPVYELLSANEDLVGWKNSTETLPSENEASVSNLTVGNYGGYWISILWQTPCRVAVTKWILTELPYGTPVDLPRDCPTVINNTHMSLNISDSIVCSKHSTKPTIPGLNIIPCNSYNLTLNVKYDHWDEQPGSNNVVKAQTELEMPGMVGEVNWYGRINSVLLNWTIPEKNPQCVESYLVTWQNQSQKTNETYFKIEEEPCSTFPVTISSLPAIELLNSTSPSISVFVSTNSVDPSPVSSDISVNYVDELSRNLSWLKPDIEDCISGYIVNISEEDSTNAAPFYSRMLDGKDTTFLLLDGDEFHQERQYLISISSYSKFNQTTSLSNSSFHMFTWDSSLGMINTNFLVGGVIFITLVIALLLTVYLIRKSYGVVLTPLVLPKETTLSLNKTLKKLNYRRRPIAVTDLDNELELLEADSGYEMSREFEEIRTISNDYDIPCTVAKLRENQSKNRYSDILPYDNTRVKLVALHGDPPSDYINASYITGYLGDQRYIATQGPTPSTLQDFWLMCYEHDVKVIVALTSLEERGRTKCAKYWPSGKSNDFGIMRVELIDEVENSFYISRDLWITKISHNFIDSPKFVRQMHCSQWPDFGCPENPETLINIVYAMRTENSSLNNKYRINSPIVVHCSAGVGRTGTLIALDILMEQARRRKLVDVVGTVLKLRKDRSRLVQTEEQYRFLYKCLEIYIRKELTLLEVSLLCRSVDSQDQSTDSVVLTEA